MKVLLAPDKFKGSLTAAQVAEHLAVGLRAQGVTVHLLPLADGGDGSVDAAVQGGFTAVPLVVQGPTGEPRATRIARQGTTWVVEVADSCGLAALPDGVLAPMTATSSGLGQAVSVALDRGATTIVLALGGSASTDGGTGLLAALGYRFLDRSGAQVLPNGAELSRISAVDVTGARTLGEVELVVASDVQNPLLGPEGAAAVYGPQKGASPDQVVELEAGLQHLVDVMDAAGLPASRCATTPGAGSAGGLGFAGLLLGARLVSGADHFLDLLGFDDLARDSDLVVTGEGLLDRQTVQGKLPAVVARRAAPVPVVAVVGRCDLAAEDLPSLGVRSVYALTDRTRADPATDPQLSARLLVELGRELQLPGC